jgi:hypothetical protein
MQGDMDEVEPFDDFYYAMLHHGDDVLQWP